MRRTNATIGAKLPYPINPSSSQTLVPFSTSSFGHGGDGHGRGRGRGGCPPRFDFSAPLRTPGQSPHTQNDSDEPPPPPPPPPPKSQGPSLLGHGHGRGRGNPLPPPSPILPSFSGFVSSAAGRGRGGLGASFFDPVPPRAPPPPQQQQQELRESEEAPPIAAEDSGNIAESIASLLPGAGRGRPQKEPEIQSAQQLNRHIQPRKTDAAWVPAAAKEMVAAAPKEAVATARKMSGEEACKHAMEVLARNSEAGRGRGRGRGVRGRGTGRGRGRGRFVEEEDEKETGLYLGDDADGERFAQKIGPEIMSLLTEGFEEVGDRVLPPAVEQMHLEALDMNFKLEFEPEFLMGDIESNPDIDEKPPIPLRDALEKAKPFVMAYENIQSQEEWEEVMKETMDRVPLLKEIVDHYSGLGRVTAKKQHQELDRVAKTLPASAPNSVKQFTERAVLSLQNNPGWGFHRKCQFMDKLVWRTSQHYK